MVDVWVPQEPGRPLIFHGEDNGTGTVQPSSPGRRHDVQCRTKRTVHERDGTCTCKGCTEEAGERIPSGAGAGKGKTGSRYSRGDRWWEHRVHRPSERNNFGVRPPCG